MAIRFRKSIKLAPGIRMNLSGGGVSWTLGTRGASVNIGKRGTYLNTGIPGTGLYSRQALTSGSTNRASTATRAQAVAPPTVNVSLTVTVEDDGAISFKDSAGNAVSEYLVETAKKQQGEVIRNLIQKSCDKMNSQVEAVAELHHDTPKPKAVIRFPPQNYTVPEPVAPVMERLGFFAKLFKSNVSRVQAQFQRAADLYVDALQQWKADKAAFDREDLKRLQLLADARAGKSEAMETFFGFVLEDIAWPRETIVSFEVLDGGTRLGFDVDLPEVEDMPNKTATVPLRGYRLSVKELGPTKVQKLYAQHVHSIGFRLLGEAFAMLPTVQEVVLSGYSQRADKATGHEQDDYLFSVRARRAEWERINFEQLAVIDVVESLGQFELVRSMTKSGAFKPVLPLPFQGTNAKERL